MKDVADDECNIHHIHVHDVKKRNKNNTLINIAKVRVGT